MTAGEAWSYDAVTAVKIESEVTTFKDMWIAATSGSGSAVSYESGWDFGYTPDAAAKRAPMSITAPGSSTPMPAATWGYEGNRTSKRDVKLDTVGGSEWFQTRRRQGRSLGEQLLAWLALRSFSPMDVA